MMMELSLIVYLTMQMDLFSPFIRWMKIKNTNRKKPLDLMKIIILFLIQITKMVSWMGNG